MTNSKPRYSMEEFARRGDSIYEQEILPHLRPEDDGKLLAIDIESGDYELDADEMAAGHRLLQRHPDAQTWMVRVGDPYLRRFGGYR